uniref:DNA-binding protein n=1 Tax=Sphingomonas sp. GlSt437 TaxID=3389970 RepID=UPI003A86049E
MTPAGAAGCEAERKSPKFAAAPAAHAGGRAAFLGLSGRTLEKHRYFGTGRLIAGSAARVVYTVDDPPVMADRGTKYSTSDPGQDDLMPRPHPEQSAGPVMSRSASPKA